MSFTKTNLVNIYFIGSITLIALIGAPLYVCHDGISLFETLLLIFYVAATGLSVTVGYHRLFAHTTYKTNDLIRFILLFFGAASFEQSALAWSSQHRDHHRYVDTENDPYNIKKGFFWAHMGWLFFGKYMFFYSNVDDLTHSKLVMHQARHYPLWCLSAGVVAPVLLGALAGHALGAFILCVCFRIFFVHHSTWCINSVCHTFGKATYDARASARDHWLVAFITFGEGYHNFHHRFPNEYRNGVKWYHWDPSKWIIAFFEKLGFVWDVKRASEFRIWDARVKADNHVAMESLEKFSKNNQVKNLRKRLQEQYVLLRTNLANWEGAFKEYHTLMNACTKPQSLQLQQAFLDKITRSRKSFLRMDRQWRRFIEHQIPALKCVI